MLLQQNDVRMTLNEVKAIDSDEFIILYENIIKQLREKKRVNDEVNKNVSR